MEIIIILVSLAGLMAVLAGCIWGLYALGRWLNRLPAHLRWHPFAAVVWSVITLFQTASLWNYRDAPNLVGHAALLIAGWVMVSSWAQFARRRTGAAGDQGWRRLPQRLFVQTLWGPLALWLGASVVCHAGERLFDNALAHRDLPTAFLLQKYGVGAITDEKYGRRLSEVIQRGDLNGVSTYLAVGVDPEGWYYHQVAPSLVTSVRQENVAVTRLLLRYGALPANESYEYGYPLHAAVESGDVRHVQALLQGGARRAVFNDAGETPFQVAKKHKNAAMVAVLVSADGTGAVRQGK